MPEELLDQMLRHAGVDEARAEGMAELVGGHSHRPPGLVAQIDCLLPAAEPVAQRVDGQWQRRVGIRSLLGEEPRRGLGPSPPDVLLLGTDGLHRWGTQGNHLLRSHLRVEVVQTRPADAVVDDGVEGQGAGVSRAQAGFDEHHHQVAGRVGEAIEVVRPLELAHHELGDEPGQGFGPPGKVLLVEGCANR